MLRTFGCELVVFTFVARPRSAIFTDETGWPDLLEMKNTDLVHLTTTLLAVDEPRVNEKNLNGHYFLIYREWIAKL